MAGRVIVVVGATGAQGLPVVRHLLNGSAPWKVRALTRDTTHHRAKELVAMGAELVEGSFLDTDAIDKLFEGDVYGAFVNTDGFTVGSAAEMQAAFKIWETAKRAQVRHFVWSSLDYSMRFGNYDPLYRNVDHYNAKGRFADFLSSQPSFADQPTGTMWTVFTNGPYMDMLTALFAPFNVREDGTRVFVLPIGDTGRIPLIALDDLGWWVRYIFDHPTETSAKNLEIASHPATGHEIVQAFKNATGLPAVYKPVSMDEYFDLWDNADVPVATSLPNGTTWEQNFRSFFAMWRDNIVPRDMDWIKSVYPQTTTLEKWIKDEKYDGRPNNLLKNVEDQRSKLRRNRVKGSKL